MLDERQNAYRLLRIAAQHLLVSSAPRPLGGFTVRGSALRALSRALDQADELENAASSSTSAESSPEPAASSQQP